MELKSGGHIVINPTEAMITIDVNSGRGSNKKNIEETAFKTNIEACEEIARQLRLRDLGGLIAIDFIDMMDKKHNADVEKSFKKALSIDKARIQLSRISKFGILELSRQKKQSTIQEISYTKCPYCKGNGLRPSLEAAALGAFRKIESEAVKGICCELKIILPHEIADYILNRKRSELLDLESEFDIALNIAGSAEIPWDNVEIQHIMKEHADVHEHLEEIAEAKTEDTSEVTVDENASLNGEKSPKKKGRRRPRHKRRRPVESATESSSSENVLPVAVSDVPNKENLSALLIIERAKQEENIVDQKKEEQENKVTTTKTDDEV